jgi:hypothetical protein
MREAALERLLGGLVLGKEGAMMVVTFTRPRVGMLTYYELMFVSTSNMMEMVASEREV